MSNISSEMFKAIAPQGKPAVILGLAQYLPAALLHYGISSDREIAYLLGQAAEETDGFRALVEYASGQAYEHRIDLGNTEPGDGPRFKGRGIFQLTGRGNYARCGAKLGVDFVDHPELAALPQYAVLTACQYWTDHNISAAADKDDVLTVTRAINGHYNGLKDRIAYTKAAAKVLNVKLPALPKASLPQTAAA